jgi:hypothetical protein
MNRVIPCIREHANELEQRLQHGHKGHRKPRLQVLYLLASGQAHTRQAVAHLLGSIATRLAAGWPSTLLATLLDTYVHTGKPVSLAPEVLTRLEQGLHRPADFASYEALRQWVGGRTAWRSSTRPCMRWCVRASGPSSKRPGPVTRKKLEAIPAFQAAYQA